MFSKRVEDSVYGNLLFGRPYWECEAVKQYDRGWKGLDLKGNTYNPVRKKVLAAKINVNTSLAHQAYQEGCHNTSQCPNRDNIPSPFHPHGTKSFRERSPVVNTLITVKTRYISFSTRPQLMGSTVMGDERQHEMIKAKAHKIIIMLQVYRPTLKGYIHCQESGGTASPVKLACNCFRINNRRTL